ncbi:MAG TPA: ricin-type beta-trefoil lectin domain protein, partial [Actinocrinis sp.]|nr:ricin-type beta-trefoil lectin domain protein [Actinocrinis sp.]
MRLTRTQTIRATALAAAVPLVAGGILVATTTNALAAPAYPTHYAAPYLQIGTDDSGDMAADMKATGLKYYTLAFLIPKSGCTPQWEDGNDGLSTFDSQISSLQAAGGNVIISSGGAEGGELAETCTSVSSLTAAYANIVSTTGVNRLDFDIEGGTLSDTAATTRRDHALAALQKSNPSVQVDFTLAVDPDGLPTGSGSEYALLQDAKNAGVNVTVVNIMTMDFGDGENALNDSETAAKGTAAQLSSLYGISTSAAYAKMGLTPIAGQNDDNENFTQANAKTLETFAASHGVGELSFWEVDEYDKAVGYAYSKTFNAITGTAGTGPTAPPTTTPPTTPPAGAAVTITNNNAGQCISVTGASSTAGSTAEIYTCNSSVNEYWKVNSNGTITNNNSGLCLSVTGNSTALKTTADINSCDG